MADHVHRALAVTVAELRARLTRAYLSGDGAAVESILAEIEVAERAGVEGLISKAG